MVKSNADTKNAAPVDKTRLEASMARLYDIHKAISENVTKVSLWRCPYKDAKDRCTANFGCRNQHFGTQPGERPVCTGSDDLDYRLAWET